MSVTPKRLVPGSVLTSTQVSYYDAPDDAKAIIQKATVTNSSGGAIVCTFWIMPPGGGAPELAYQLTVSAAASVTTVVAELARHVIEAGGRLYAQAATGSVVSLQVSGVEVTA